LSSTGRLLTRQTCPISGTRRSFRGDGAALREALARDEIGFHAGSIRGAFPRIL